MLSKRATVGEYQRRQTKDGKEYPVGDPVPGYYPPVIDESMWTLIYERPRRNHFAELGITCAQKLRINWTYDGYFAVTEPLEKRPRFRES
jgi:hypothetical protein